MSVCHDIFEGHVCAHLVLFVLKQQNTEIYTQAVKMIGTISFRMDFSSET